MARVPTRWAARILLGCALLAPFTLVAADQGKTPAKPAAGRVFQITVDKVSFEDAPTGIKPGDTIEWVNKDIFEHTSTSRTGLWDVTIPAGKKVRVVMKKIGTFEYYCKLHPNMTGTIVVR
ncbi:MAG TPA: cupredoxin domain-containing protein [Vicinamibacterales bacterium]|nr:cupredoxin domain-containing protein [Vicinamibacterales bacterium]